METTTRMVARRFIGDPLKLDGQRLHGSRFRGDGGEARVDSRSSAVPNGRNRGPIGEPSRSRRAAVKVLVTGGAGYIGAHACKALAAAGHTPIVFDNLRTGHRWAVRWGPFEHGDLLDPRRLWSVFNRHRPDAVMHFHGPRLRRRVGVPAGRLLPHQCRRLAQPAGRHAPDGRRQAGLLQLLRGLMASPEATRSRRATASRRSIPTAAPS